MTQASDGATVRIARAAIAPHTGDEATGDRARLLLFDYLAVATRGSRTASSAAALAAAGGVGEERTSGSAIIEGTGRRAGDALEAALVNGVSAHSIELDDTHEPASLHPGAVVWPAVLALADALGTTSDAALDAGIAGYDAMCHVGEMLGGAAAYARGFHPTGVCGVFGAAAAAGRLLGLDEEQMTHALGIAAASASGSMEYLRDGSWTKRLHPGLAAANGLRAARLAAAGFTGPASAIEGPLGFLHAYGGDASRARGGLRSERGDGVRQTSVKLHACCRYIHGIVDLLIDLAGERHIEPDDIREIDCGILSAGIALIAEPPEAKVDIRNDVEAQFSLPFAAALAITTGRATLEDFEAAPAYVETLSPLMRRVSYHTSPALEAAFPARWTAEVRIRWADGSETQRATDAFRGSPARPASWDDVQEKASGLIGSELAAEMAGACRAIGGTAPLADAFMWRERGAVPDDASPAIARA